MLAYTLITGASDGLGVEFARLAAREGRNMILTARREDKLHALADELASDDIEIVVIPADLSGLAEAARLWTEATQERRIDVFVNNAGLGSHDAFADVDGWARELASIQVNMVSFTYLMKQAIAHMNEHGGGRVLNVASTAGFMPGPNMAVYHATKAYALHLSEAVAEELRGSKVTVTALCPGATKTGFHAEGKMLDARLLKYAPLMKPFPVAEEGWLEARIGKRVVVPGVVNKVFAQMPRVMPRSIVTRIANLVMSKA